ncbi:hypothetical protein ACFWUP_04775 [Nocardia sp. NPDC058658]|uniref:hypothetical protein n=1 Tax=Nocardia sp. NPDC058658 TaxID=3346580 RepID=UPI0036602A1A
MTENSPTPGTHLSGNIVAGVIGGSGNSGAVHGGVTINADGDRDQIAVLLEQLRGELSALRAQLPMPSDGAAEPGDVDDVLDDLDTDFPRAANRWARLYRRIPPALTDLSTLDKIVGLFERVQTLT